MGRIINVIVVDDSAFMRKSLSLMLESDPQIKVIATARDGQEGIEKIKQLKPDLVTMDIEMPTMDGLTALAIIMKEIPVPVLMVSSLTTDGAKATLDALNLGAVDFIPKELSYVSLDIVKIKEELVNKVKQIALSKSLQFRLQRIRNAAGGDVPRVLPKSTGTINNFVNKVPRMNMSGVVVGISTGGPFALLQILPKIPAAFPVGIAIVQHMPPHFTRSMAERLNGLCQVEVREAEEGDVIKPGLVLIAPGGQHMTFVRHGGDIEVRISIEPMNTVFRPSADVMMSSAAEVFRSPLLGLIMTGMGKDGLEGLKLIKRKGGYVVAQNEETCVVYGMPKAAVDEGLADQILPLEKIPIALSQIAGVA
jgi:two-component system, chemotaxis family, protein-glutamate methylesterase/glutaminase